MSLYLSRLTVSRDPAISALSGLIDPAGSGQALDAHHKLVWSAFAAEDGAKRDFLWRAEGQGRFLVLSSRPPGASPVFAPPQVQAFAPDLRQGDALAFALRANATKTVKRNDGTERKRHIDLVMDALPDKGPERAANRSRLAAEVGGAWLERQGERAGFHLAVCHLEDYSVRRLRRDRRAAPITFGVLDLRGVLTVTNPETFLAALAQGFGRAKAFGCGLMLIRRA